MAYQATIIPVMIASPGDVSDERTAIRNTLHEWNDINSVNSKLMLAPVGWDSHSSPELGARPQELINKRVLKDCDLLIGVFWTRIGTHTGVAASGSVEEIEEHVAAGKPAMIYFSSRPVVPESLDQQQYVQLKEFKAWCKSQGLIHEFANLGEFKAVLWKHLSLCLQRNPYLRGLWDVSKPLGVEEPASIPEPSHASESSAEADRLHLGSDAITLLLAAASTDGFIYRMQFIDGRHFQAGRQTLGGGANREFARWQAALQELLEMGLVIARGYKEEIYELTLRGWGQADLLGRRPL